MPDPSSGALVGARSGAAHGARLAHSHHKYWITSLPGWAAEPKNRWSAARGSAPGRIRTCDTRSRRPAEPLGMALARAYPWRPPGDEEHQKHPDAPARSHRRSPTRRPMVACAAAGAGRYGVRSGTSSNAATCFGRTTEKSRRSTVAIVETPTLGEGDDGGVGGPEVEVGVLADQLGHALVVSRKGLDRLHPPGGDEAEEARSPVAVGSAPA